MSEANEKTRLTELYSKMLDGEIEKIFADFSELTWIAQGALQSEIDKRGLIFGVPGEPAGVQVHSKQELAPYTLDVPKIGGSSGGAAIPRSS